MKLAKLMAAGLCVAGLTFGAHAQGDNISKSAAVYATYQSAVTDAKTSTMNSAGDIDSTLNNLGGHNADSLTKGWIAYSAMVASQNSEYRAAIRDIESYYGRDTLMNGLKLDPRYARTLNGGNSAVAAAASASTADARRLSSAAAQVKEQAYSLQGAGWAKAKIGDSGAKATALDGKQRSGQSAKGNLVNALGASDIDNALRSAGQSGAPSLWESVSSSVSSIRLPSGIRSSMTSRHGARPGNEQVADQIATLAAYRVMGSSAANSSDVYTAMNEQGTSSCMKMAQLNLQQCVAASHQQFEVPFCIGEHALADVGKCITQ